MEEYKIPEEYYFRLHHVRPRFKGDIENVLIYVAEEITRVGEKETEKFVEEVNAALFRYPGNAQTCRLVHGRLSEFGKTSWKNQRSGDV